MSKSSIKFYLVPFIVLIVIVVIGVVLSVLKSSNTTSFQLSPTKKPPLNSVSPTPHSLLPTVIPP
ncbi:MAG: hypothetical protein V1922_04055, partial [bacterium]